MKWLLIGFVKFYSAVISPIFHAILGPLGGCRFTPGCANYAKEALETHGALKGTWLSLKRIGRCHPWCPGGHDPVPPPKDNQQARAKRPDSLKDLS